MLRAARLVAALVAGAVLAGCGVTPPHQLSPATPDPADELVGAEVRLDGPRRVAKAELVNRGGLLGWFGFGRRA